MGGVTHNLSLNGSNKYILNGGSDTTPELSVSRGYTYYININTPNHQVAIQTDSNNNIEHFIVLV